MTFWPLTISGFPTNKTPPMPWPWYRLWPNNAKEKYRGMFEIQKSGDKTSSGEIGLDIWTHASPKVWQDQVSGGVSVPCRHATPVANALWKPIISMSGFYGAFATGVAYQQGTLTLPVTWFPFPHFWTCLRSNCLNQIPRTGHIFTRLFT